MSTLYAFGAFLDDHAGAVGAATSIFVAIFTAVLAWKTWGLHRATRGLQEFAAVQAEDMKASVAQAARAASAMENVSKSLERNTKTTEEIVERQKRYVTIQLRAYVFPNDYGLYDGSLLNPPQVHRFDIPGVVINFRNAGHTPATQVISWAKISVIDNSKEDTLLVPKLDNISPITLSSGATFSKSQWFERMLTTSEKEDIKGGVKGIYVYGRIQYVDCFGDDKFANFRVRYNGAFPPLPPSGVFTHCQDGNESD
jgi:hypothetical protein